MFFEMPASSIAIDRRGDNRRQSGSRLPPSTRPEIMKARVNNAKQSRPSDRLSIAEFD
jgi:hypothetical protein